MNSSAGCKIAPWLQSKSMQSKQEMATIEEAGGRRRRGGRDGGEETDGELDSQSLEERGKRVPGSEDSSQYQLSLRQEEEWLCCFFSQIGVKNSCICVPVHACCASLYVCEREICIDNKRLLSQLDTS